VAEAWIVDRPGRERGGDRRGDCNQCEATDLAHAAAQDRDDVVGNEVRIEVAIDRGHRSILAEHRDNAV
jgi:hypothetical protein